MIVWRNRLVYLFLVIYSALFVVLYQEYTSFLVTGLLILLPLVMAAVICLVVKPKLEVSLRENTGYLKQGEQADIILNVENRSVLPVLSAVVWVQLYYVHETNIQYEKIKLYADSKSSREFMVTISPKHCGLLNVRVHKLRLYDYFGIYAMNKKNFGEIQLLVVPKEVSLEEKEKMLLVQSTGESEEFSKEKAGDDPTEIFDIRAYHEGDRLQRVHWKLSSKKEKLLVKEFSLPIMERVVLFIVLQTEEEAFDAVMQKTAAIGKYFLQQEQEVWMYWCAGEILHQQKLSKTEDMLFLLQQIYEDGVGKEENIRDVLVQQMKPEDIANGYYIRENSIGRVADMIEAY